MRHTDTIRRLFLRAVLAAAFVITAGAANAQNPPWRQLGPDQRGLGQVNVLAFDLRDPSHVFAGLNGGGIARSDDGGQTWQMKNAGLTAPRVTSIVVHPMLGSLIYVIADGRVHRSTNGGLSWDGLPLDQARVIAPDPRSVATVWAGTEAGLFRSTNGGTSWVRIQGNLPAAYRVESLAIDSRTSQRIYIGITGSSGFGFWVSENGGRSWVRRSRAVPTRLYADLHTAATVYFQLGTTLYRSRDAGQTLQPFFTPPAFPGAAAGVLAPDPRNASTFYLTARNSNGGPPTVFWTTNAGRTWRPFVTGLPADVEPTALAVSSDGHVLLGTHLSLFHFAVFRSPASAPAWQRATQGLINAGVGLIAVGRDGALFITVGGEGVLRSLDDGATWTVSLPVSDLGGGSLGPIAVAPSDSDTLYVGTSFGGGRNPHVVWKSTDGGDTWTALPYFPPVDGEGRSLTVVDLAVDPADPETVFAATNLDGGGLNAWAGLYRSRDGGQTWERLGPSGPYTAVEIHPSEPERVFALFAVSALYRSTDGGDTWAKVLERTGNNVFLTHLVIAPSNPDIVYVVQSDGILFRSDDGGATFTSLGRRLRREGVRSIVVDPEDPDTLVFMSSFGPVRLTLGRGREPLVPVFFSHEIGSLLFDPNDPLRLLAGTSGAGLVEYRFAEP